jgi:hypothetical protein
MRADAYFLATVLVFADSSEDYLIQLRVDYIGQVQDVDAVDTSENFGVCSTDVGYEVTAAVRVHPNHTQSMAVGV